MTDELASRRLPDDVRAAPVREFGAAFIEAHRQKIFLGLSVAGTLLLGPFAVNNFVQGRLLLGVITTLFVLCLLAYEGIRRVGWLRVLAGLGTWRSPRRTGRRAHALRADVGGRSDRGLPDGRPRARRRRCRRAGALA